MLALGAVAPPLGAVDVQEIRACAAYLDPSERLACFDALVARLPTVVDRVPGRRVSSGNRFHDYLLSRDDVERRDVLERILGESGKACGRVDETFFQGLDENGSAYWNARCSNGEAYAIGITADAEGTSRVFDCAYVSAATDVRCFRTLDSR